MTTKKTTKTPVIPGTHLEGRGHAIRCNLSREAERLADAAGLEWVSKSCNSGTPQYTALYSLEDVISHGLGWGVHWRVQCPAGAEELRDARLTVAATQPHTDAQIREIRDADARDRRARAESADQEVEAARKGLAEAVEALGAGAPEQKRAAQARVAQARVAQARGCLRRALGRACTAARRAAAALAAAQAPITDSDRQLGYGRSAAARLSSIQWALEVAARRAAEAQATQTPVQR